MTHPLNVHYIIINNDGTHVIFSSFDGTKLGSLMPKFLLTSCTEKHHISLIDISQSLLLC